MPRELAIKVVVDKSQATPALKEVEGGLQNVSKETSVTERALLNMGGMVKAAIGGLLGTMTVSTVIAFTREIAAFSSHMNDLSIQTGIGVEKLQALNYAASGSGVGVDELGAAVSQLSKRLFGGEDAAVQAVTRLGLSVSDLIREEPDQAFLDIADAVRKITNPMEQNSVAMELFGRTGARLLPLLKDDIRALTDEAERNGAVISRNLIEKADSLDDAWSHLMIRGKALIATVLIPLTDLLNGKANSDYSLFGQIDRFLGSGTQASTDAALKKVMGGPDTSRAANMHTFVMSLHEAQNAMADWEEQSKKTVKAEEEAARREAQIFKAQMDNNHAYWDMVTKVDHDMLEIRRALVTGFYQEQENIAFKAGQAILEETLELNRSLISLDAERTRNLLAVNTPGMFVAVTQAGLHQGTTFAQSLLAATGEGLKGIGPTILSALQGGGDILKSIGSTMGMSFSKNLFGNDKFTGMITSHFHDALGGMINAILPGVGALVGPLLGKIASLFAGIGGPNAAERQGRALTDSFAQQMKGTLDWMEQIELHTVIANGASEKWAETMIGVRDAYLRAGHSAQEAEAIVARLFEAEKRGGTAVQQVIDEITLTMHDSLPDALGVTTDKFHTMSEAGVMGFDTIKDAATAAGDAAAVAANVALVAWQKLPGYLSFNGGSAGNGTSEGRNESHILDGLTAAQAQSVYLSTIANPNSTAQDWERVRGQYGFANGTGGRFWDFGKGTPVTLHGKERVMTEAEGRDQLTPKHFDEGLRRLGDDIRASFKSIAVLNGGRA